jgi:hypothetical protein
VLDRADLRGIVSRMLRKPSRAETTLLRALEAGGLGIWLWSWYEFAVWRPGEFQPFDAPEKAIFIALLASSLLLVCFLLRLVLSLPSAVEKWEAAILLVLALWYPVGFGCWCLTTVLH